MIATNCPDLNCLHDYLFGRLDDATAAELEQHLETCAACEQTMSKLEAEPDSLVGMLQAGKGSGEPVEEDAAIASAQAFAASLAERLRPGGNLQPANYPIVGAYELIRLLGQGGMGAVYLARHRKLDKQVAIKLLPAFSGQRPEVVARFQREIRASGKLDHPAIVRATDAGEVDGVHFLVMDAIEGMDVGQIGRTAGQLTIADACEIGRQAAIGLAYAHAQGITHRDVKPSNLMLSGDGQVKILDFGLAQMSAMGDELPPLTAAGEWMGTLDYMAPEQAAGSETPDARADIYALGATLYRLLGGRPPLSSPGKMTPLEKLRLIAEHSPAPIETLCDDLPAELSQLVMQMLQRDPADRPQSATEVAERLAPFCRKASLMSLIEHGEGSAKVESKSLRAAETVTGAPSTPGSSKAKRSGGGWWWVVAACFAAFVCGGIWLTLQTGQGTLTIESEVGNVSVRLLKDGKEVRALEIHPGEQVTKLYSGAYELVLDTPSDAFTLSQDQVEIKSGETVVAKVRMKRAPMMIAPAEAPKVTLGKVESKSVTVKQQYVCQIRSSHAIDIRAPESGYLTKMQVHTGERVKQADSLFQTTPTVDNDANAKLQAIRAPFAGVVGRINFEKGSLVEKGETLATLSDNRVMAVDFHVPEARVEPYREAESHDDLKLELLLANGRKYEQVGRLVSIEPGVNPKTGNTRFTAEFPNPLERLLPGQSGVLLISKELKDAIVVPQQATFEILDKRYVFVVDDQNVAHQREIVIQNELDDLFVVQSGVSVNDKIVVGGVRQVRDGEKVE